MNLLFFSPYYYPYTSGITTYPQKLFAYLAQEHAVKVLTFPHQACLQSVETKDNYQIIRMPYSIKISKGYLSPQSLPIFAQQLNWADVVILNLPNVEGLPLAFLANRQHKPFISLFHCMVHLSGSPAATIVNQIIKHTVIQQLKLSNRIVAYTQDYFNSQGLEALAHKTDFVLPPISSTQPDASFLKKLKQQKQKEKWVGFAGRTAREKGIEFLISAFVEVQQRDKDQPHRLVVAGPAGNEVAGESSYFEYIKQLLEQKKIAHTFLGNLAASQLSAFYQTIDVLVLPSINQTEAFGMVQAEAMLQGTPVIASDLPGVRVPIQLTGMGEIVQPSNVTDLTNALNTALQNPTKYTKHQAKANQIFDEKKTFDYFSELITKLAKNV